MKRILLVADAEHSTEEIATILVREGYQVTIANSAMQALKLLAESNPDMIITELVMTGMDGFELVQKIKTTSSFKLIPIIILSSGTSETDRIRGKEVGADAFIEKPFNPHDLLGSIQVVFKRRNLTNGQGK